MPERNDRLTRFEAGDLAAVLDQEAPVPRMDDPAAVQEAALLHWYRYLAQDRAAGRDDLRAACSLFDVLRRSRPDGLPPQVREALEAGGDVLAAVERSPGTAYDRGRALLTHALSHRDATTLDAAIAELRGGLPGDDRWRGGLLAQLVPALLSRYDVVRSDRALQDAVDALRQALSTVGPDAELRPAYAERLARMLYLRAKRAPSTGNLDEAIAAALDAVDVVDPGDPDRPAKQATLHRAAAQLRQIREAVVEAGEATLLSGRGQALWSRYEHTGDPTLAREALDAFRASVAAQPEPGDLRGKLLSNLAVPLLRLGDVASLREARRVLTEAAGMGAFAERPLVLANLATALHKLFQRDRDRDTADEAVRRMREAIAATEAGTETHAVLLADAGHVWAGLADLSRDPGVLAEIEPRLREAAADESLAPQVRGELLAAAASVWGVRGLLTGEVSDLDAAVEAGHRALDLAEPHRRADRLVDLALALSNRYELDHRAASLDAAIGHLSEMLDATAGPAVQSILGALLKQRYDRFHDPTDLDAAVRSFRRATSVSAASFSAPSGSASAASASASGSGSSASAFVTERGRYLSNLGSTLLAVHWRTRDRAPLDEAVRVLREAVDATAPDDSERGPRLANLALALREVVLLDEDQAALPEAAAVARRAVDTIGPDDPVRAPALLNLSTMEMLGGRHAEARSAALSAARTGGAAVGYRLAAWHMLGRLHADAADWEKALDAYRSAVELLPAGAGRDLSRGDQEYRLAQQTGIATEAASCALRAGRPLVALELLELGRGQLLSQALETRGDLTRLRADRPGLAEEFDRLRRELDAAPPATAATVARTADARAAQEERDTLRRRRLAADWTALHERIRAVPGFERFHRPPAEAELLEAAAGGPVVVLNASPYGTDAIAVTPSGLRVIALPEATPDALREHASRLCAAVAARRATEVHAVLGWLWRSVSGPVLDGLGFGGPPAPGTPWPRLWWVPTGHLTLLPVHAAGDVPDRIVSSYAATLGMLRHAHGAGPAGEVGAGPGMSGHAGGAGPAGEVGAGPLIVAMPRTPGLPDLPGADREAVLVAARRPGATTLTGAQATRAAVLAALPGHASAHFACHAYSDPDEPSRSHLVLHDHRASPLTVADVARLDLGGARLAYLSACATAESSAALPDEVVHIASAFGLAGYPDVIATLWPIADEPAVHVADGVYRGITVDGHPPALALHDAVRAMRRRFPEDPWLWAPFIHYGR